MAAAAPKIDYRKGFGWNLALNVFTKIATPLLAILIARHLGPAVMGAYAIVTTVLIFSDIFRDSVLVRVYLREDTHNAEQDRSYATLSAYVHGGMALIIAGLGLPFAAAFGARELAPGLPIAAVAVALNGFSALPYTKLLKQGDFKRAAFAESMGSVLSSAYAFALVLAGAGFYALVTMVVVRSLIFLALTYRFAPVQVGRSSNGLFRRIAGTSGELTITNLLWVGFSFGDQLLVSRLLGVSVGGFYATGKMMVASADVIAKPLLQTSTVAIAERKDDPDATRRTLAKALAAFLLVIAPIYFVVALFAQPLVMGILGEKFAGTVAVVPPLCLYFACIYPGSFAADSLVMAGKARIPLYGWLANYLYLAIAISLFWRSGEVSQLAWILASGLVLVNISTLTFAVRQNPFSPAQWSSLGRGGLALGLTTLLATTIGLLPIVAAVQLGLAFTILPLFHAAVVGIIFGRNPKLLGSRSGIRRLFEAIG